LLNSNVTAIVIGAGPAGLTAGYSLSKAGKPVLVLEADPEYVGGLSRTVHRDGFRFDIGGHRFFSKSREIENLWTEILGDDLLVRPRLSRIYYNNHFLAYPIRPFEVLRKLGLIESTRAIASYVKARLAPVRNPRTFEDWVTNEFGAYLFRAFFKTYTEKVWGMSCQEISADWAAQRINGLSLGKTIRGALGLAGNKSTRRETVKTLVSSFRYPRLGPGMMWDRTAELIRANAGTVLLGHEVTRCRFLGDQGWEVTATTSDGTEHVFRSDHVISSAPIRELADMLDPTLPGPALAAAKALRYRDFITIAVVLDDRTHLADNWIYVHDPGVRVGRIQNFKAWSPDLVPDPSLTCSGLEYFCFEGDGLWTSSDAALATLAAKELVQLGLATQSDIRETYVVRQRKAYPVYDDVYVRHVGVIRDALASYPTLHLVGRNGMHKYNNQDHAMMTAILTVRNILGAAPPYDVWRVNQDAEYHESSTGTADDVGGRAVPRAIIP
jgi:protoporphyrinogen oxidase